MSQNRIYWLFFADHTDIISLAWYSDLNKLNVILSILLIYHCFQIVKAYNGPKSPFYEWPNAYAFFLFKQESANDITIDSSNFSIPFSPQSSLSTFKTTYSLAGRFFTFTYSLTFTTLIYFNSKGQREM